MTKRNIIRFIISFIFGVLLFFRFGGEAYAAEATHTCPSGKGYASNATKLTSGSTFAKINAGNTVEYYYYYLDGDVTFDETKTIGSYTSITICLNGHVLKGNGSAALFQISGLYSQLTICDCKHDDESYIHKFTVSEEKTWNLHEDSGEESIKGGVITNGGGNTGAIYVSSEGTLNLYNVNIVGNKGLYGVINCSYGTLNMNNCLVKGNGSVNESNSKGGGIYLGAYPTISTIKNTVISNNVAASGAGIYCVGKLNMENVEISNNTASYQGGGFYLRSNTVTLKNSTIKDNTSSYSGGGIMAGGSGSNKLILDGIINISGNKKNASPNNIVLDGDKLIKINPGFSVPTDTPIGISSYTSLVDAPLIVTNESDTEDYSSFFQSEASTCRIIYDDGYVKMVTYYAISVQGSNAGSCKFTVEGNSKYNNTSSLAMGISPGTKITVTHTSNPGYLLDKVYYNDGEEHDITDSLSFNMPSNNVTIKATYIKLNIITFHPNGGIGNMADYETLSSSYNLPKCRFLPPLKKAFAGWSYYSTGPIINTKSINLSGDITLYAIWENHPNHSFTDTELQNNITKRSCKCGYYIIRYN